MKHSLLLSLLMFGCFGMFGQSSSVPPQKVTTDQLKSSIIILQDSIENLKAQNRDLQMQMNNMREKVDTYQKLVSDTTSNMHDDMSDFFAKIIGVLSLIGLVLGVAAPLYFNYRNEKNMEKLLEDAKDKAGKAEDALTNLHPKVEKAEGVVTIIEKLSDNVEDAAKKAKAVQYFVQALQESDEKRAIELYDKCIALDDQFAEAYNNRGFLRHKIGGPNASKQAKDDYTTAITLFDNQGRGIYAEAYNNRGILHFENQELDKAKDDFNAAISKDYPEAYLNRGLLHFQKSDDKKAWKDFNNAIAKKSNFAEAYYIRGLFRYNDKFDRKGAIDDFGFAIAIKNHVVEGYPNRGLLTGKMKDLDNSINEVGFSKDMTKIIIVSKEKKDPFMVLASIKEIEDGAFAGCTKLNEILVDEKNNYYRSKDGVLFSKDMSKLIAVPGGKNTIVIPDSVTKIEDYAIKDCANLTELHLKHKTPIDFSSAFLGLDKTKVSIYVPKGSGEAYKNSEYYQEFKKRVQEE